MVSVKIDREPINKLKKEIDQRLIELKNDLNMFNTEGPVFKKVVLIKQVEDLRNNLDEPNRQYQAYLLAIEKWTAGQAEIIGDETTSGTIKHLEKKIFYLNELPEKLHEV